MSDLIRGLIFGAVMASAIWSAAFCQSMVEHQRFMLEIQKAHR
jgi:hypothetical protein